MHRPTQVEVKLRQKEQLRDAERRRWAARVRPPDRRVSRVLRTFGLGSERR